MTNPITQNAYLVANGTGTIYPTVFFSRAPTPNDLSFPISQRWINTAGTITASITAATRANPCVITAMNTFVAGQIIYIQGVGGMIQLNNQFFTVVSATSTTITLNVDSTNFGVYTSGGTATSQMPIEYILLSLFTQNGFTQAQWALLSEASSGMGLEDVVRSLSGNDVVKTFPDADGNLRTLGTGSITVLGSANTETTQLTGLTNHAVLVGAGTPTITKVGPNAASGIPLISQGAAADPAFGTAVVAGGGTGDTSFANLNSVLFTGTTATGAFQAPATGVLNTVLTSNGPGVLPTFKGITVLQQVRTSTSALVHVTNTISWNDTIPQNTDGGQIFTLAITPTSVSTKLLIEAEIFGGLSTAGAIASMALFQDSTANALAAVSEGAAVGFQFNMSLIFSMTSGTTSSTTFKIRAGGSSGNLDVNGTGANARLFGGVAISSLTITEYSS